MADSVELTGLHAEFYQLVTAAVYHADGLWGDATFDLYARALPEGVGFMVAAGMEEAIAGIEALGFTDAQIAWLRGQEVFQRASDTWWRSLKHLRFQGDVYALPEGAVAFPDTPLLRVTAPLIQAVLLETRLIQLIGAASGVATRSARLVEAAAKRPVLDFGSRRLPDPESAARAARAAWIGGTSATSNALAGARYGLPMMGTLSPTFNAAYPDDGTALDAFSLHFPEVGFLSLPEGDMSAAVATLAGLSSPARIVRLDRWNLARAAHELRSALDAAGLGGARIMGSGSLDPVGLARVLDSDPPLDMIAVGTHLVGGANPSMRYRLAEMSGGFGAEPVTRPGASRYPGRKQVVRLPDRDIICTEDEIFAHEMAGIPARLVPWIVGGERVRAPESLATIRMRRARELSALPRAVRRPSDPVGWPVEVSERLGAMALG